MADHPHDYSAEVVVCSVCHRTEADITRSCHHCSDGVGRCWWCLRDAARAKDAEAHAAALAAKDAEIVRLRAQIDEDAHLRSVVELYRSDPIAMADALVRMREALGAAREQLEQRPCMTRYVIAERRMVQRPHIDGGGLSQETWVPAPVYGQHETRQQAKAHYMRRLDPGLRRVVDDAFCARHFDQRARNIGDVKVVKA